ncbi:HNH endonuclease domain-containing protein [Fibrella sp. WM1]|uniref:HNH endonuclease domain-containing protein n=1 Tax=Fibrella musci TaxID=3242485 RepID=UPI003520439C
MELPITDDVDVPSLSKVFNDTTNSYKFYWFLALLDALQRTGNSRISMQELSVQMVAKVWYPLAYYNLSFGTQDQFKAIAHVISSHITVNTKSGAPDLVSQLRTQLTDNELAAIYERVRQLLRWVPYRFIRPFFDVETRGLPDHQVNKAVVDLANTRAKAPYRFDGEAIVINDSWVRYFGQHQHILRGFINWHLVRFLQKNNPNVAAISEKLERPTDRNFKIANPFWKTYLHHHPDLTCLYSGQSITTANLSLDHFLPFSFVAHDQLWNLIPTTKAVNSAKNDWLPHERYFDKYAQLQFDAFQFHAEARPAKMLDDYSVLFRESIATIQNNPFDWFRERLSQAVLPQLQTAQNMGFSYPFYYKPT